MHIAGLEHDLQFLMQVPTLIITSPTPKKASYMVEVAAKTEFDSLNLMRNLAIVDV